MKNKNYLLIFGLSFVSVVLTYFVTTSTIAQTGTGQMQATSADNEYQIGAILFMQHAAEYRALCFQSFNVAKMYFDSDFDKKNLKKLPKPERKRPRAVIVDIDETVLDNSPAQAFNAKNHLPFVLKDWYAWGEMRKAKAIPGAVDFLNYANSKGAKVFYISNRDDVQKQATIDNLKAVGFPDATAETVLLRDKDSSKKGRRDAVAAKYRIVLIAGDNLNDLSEVFERKPVVERFMEVDKTRELYGAKYIVLPNAMYGEWEGAIYNFQRLTDAEKSAKRRESLVTFEN